ncbi:MAG: DUF5666 domain-containing protein [Terriglobales bacterium]
MLWPYKPSLSPRIGLALLALLAFSGRGFGQSQPAGGSGAATVSRAIGTVKAINGNQVTLTSESGSEVSVLMQDSTQILRTAPGQTSLKDATPMPWQELQVGDRLFVRGTPSSDHKSILASLAVVMKQSDVAARQARQRDEWRRRGTGGLVKAVNPAGGTVQISVASFAGTKDLTIRVSPSTVIRRYAPDSVKFDDAKPGTIAEIKGGDQLRARGAKSQDGTELEAEEIVSGSFRNIAGTVSSIDAGENTITVADLISKKPVTVKFTNDSQIKQLPAMFAQRIAMRLKGGAEAEHPGGAGGNAAAPAAANGERGGGPGSQRQPGQWRGGAGYGGGGGAGGGPPDLQQILSRLPATTLADLHKGDAVMIVTTEGSANAAPTAITMLSGVEALLTASPNSSASTLLSPWNLGASPPADAATE